ncbi:hypothetical protein FB451DRAFT_1514571 [Mycena latifolia]|nr:hypothetical protein FB451DRAFT_1514571 [Mycena latifolia]
MDILTHFGVEAWLEDPKGRKLSLEPAVVSGNQITAVIKVGSPKSYCISWRKKQGAPALNAWCEVFRPAGRTGHHDAKVVRVANDFMAVNNLQTQSRSSKGELEHPLQRDAWLWTPPSRTGFVSLEIRRLNSPPMERERVDKSRPGVTVFEIEVDLLDKDEGPPYIVFRFEFEPKGDPMVSIPSSGASRVQNEDPSDAERPPLVSVGKGKKRKNVLRGEGSPSKKRTVPSRVNSQIDEAPPDHEQAGVRVLLKKRKTIMQQQDELAEANELKRAEREKLVKDLEKDNKSRAKELAKEKKQSKQLDATPESCAPPFDRVSGKEDMVIGDPGVVVDVYRCGRGGRDAVVHHIN